MGKFRVEIDLDTTVTFESNKIKQLSTRTMATNDPTKPVFDVFANQGLLVIKDTDLSIYNKAIDGTFDNLYQFNVRFYKGNNLIANHIINQRPIYDYTNKTFTLNLGNELDNINNILYKGYDYPLKEEPLQDLTNDILRNIFTTNSFELINENDTTVLKNISVPYLPEMSTKQALKKVCEAQGSSLIINPSLNKTNFYFVDMLGRSSNNKKIYKLLPKHIKSSFKPNIILDNRFSNAIVNATSLYKQTHEVLLAQKEGDVSKISKDPTDKNSYSSYKKYTIPNDYEPEAGEYFVDLVGIKQLNNYYYAFVTSIERKTNKNLSTVVSVPSPNVYEDNSKLNGENINPTISLSLQKKVYDFVDTTATFNGSKTTIINWDTDYDAESLKIGTPTITNLSSKYIDSKIHYEFFKSFSSGNRITFNKDLYENRFLQEPIIYEPTNSFDPEAFILVGYSYLQCYADRQRVSEASSSQYIDAKVQLVEILPIAISYSYNGVVEEIKFDKNLQIKSTYDNVNKIETEKGNELIQTNLDGTIEGSSAELLQKDLYNFYKNGIRTGELEVIFDNYVAEDGVTQKNIDTPFKIGDLVIPCKDNQGTPIIGKNEKSYKEKTVSSLGNNKTQKATFHFNKKINRIIDVYGYSTNTGISNIVSIKNYIVSGHSVLVNYSTILAGEITIRVDVDFTNFSVYKVVDVEIDYNGGAGSQRLKLMEQPNLTLEDTATTSEASEASEPMATMLLSEETPLETEIDESQSVLSNNNETSQEMSNNGFDDLINL